MSTISIQATNEVAASVLGNEVEELKQTKVEGLSEDPEMRLESRVNQILILTFLIFRGWKWG